MHADRRHGCTRISVYQLMRLIRLGRKSGLVKSTRIRVKKSVPICVRRDEKNSIKWDEADR